MVKPSLLSLASYTAALSATLLVCGAARADDTTTQLKLSAKVEPTSPSTDASQGLPQQAVSAEPPAKPAWETQPSERRGGFTVGLSLGAGIASLAGFPADPKKVNRLRYYTETGVRPTGIASFWIGSAITDWFVFGVGVTGGGLLATGDTEALSGGIIFHLEAFPLFPFGGRLRELGVMINTGVGIARVTPDKDPNHDLIDGTGASLIGGGVFYEGLRFWRLAMGPFLAGDYYWSEFVRRPSIFLGWRTSLYTLP